MSRRRRPWPCAPRRFVSTLSALNPSVSQHRGGVTNQTSLRSLWTMMTHANLRKENAELSLNRSIPQAMSERLITEFLRFRRRHDRVLPSGLVSEKSPTVFGHAAQLNLRSYWANHDVINVNFVVQRRNAAAVGGPTSPQR